MNNKFEIRNYAGCLIAVLTEEELDEARTQGLINYTDTIKEVAY